MAYLLFIVLIILMVLCITYSRKKQFSYGVKADYVYDNLINSEIAVLYGNCVKLPQNILETDTVIAKVKVKSTLLGQLVMPWITVSSEKGQWRMYLEYGAKGVRYINLSGTFNDSREIRLVGHNVLLNDQEIELSIYPSEELDQKKVLVLAPHADDAELSAYGLYEKQAKNALVVTVTISESGSFHYGNLYTHHKEDETAQYFQKARMRVWNSLAVPQLAGVSPENILQLGFFDGTLSAMKRNPTQEIGSSKLNTADVNIFRSANLSSMSKELKGGSTWNDLVDNLAYLIERFQPDIIVSPSPNIDVHKDHQHTTLAALEALKKINYQNGKLFLHTLHYLSDDFPIGKCGSILSLPPKFTQPFYFQSIYSLPLTREEQNRKFLALDAMNDIRPNADIYRSWKTMIFQGLNKLRHNIFHMEKDLLNRFVRSNELFYVVAVKDIYQDEIYRQITHQG